MNNNQLQELINIAKDNNLLNEELQYVVDQYNEYLQNKEDNSLDYLDED